MSEIDLSLMGNYLDSSDDLSSLESYLVGKGDTTAYGMNIAMAIVFSRVANALNMDKDVYDQLSNINKFYLLRGALPEQEQELRKFILERFYKSIS